MSRISVTLLSLTLALAAGAASAADKPEKRGRAIARESCASCHAVEANRAASPVAKAPPFASVEMQHTAGLEGRLANLTAKGHYGMPPITLDAQQVEDLKLYIESIARR